MLRISRAMRGCPCVARHTHNQAKLKMENPWIAGFVVYLIGCAATYALNLLYALMTRLVASLTGDSVMGKNIIKLAPKDDIKDFVVPCTCKDCVK